ncbi:MAG: MerR family transcriptional regulator [Nitriliruptoraceae bacterium]
MTAYAIGAVIELLQDEFPDVTVSKIRFLETEGLLAPSRTASGYRRFSQDDVGRLLYILRAQRDRYLPLKVIRDELATITSFIDIAPAPQQGSLLTAANESPDTASDLPNTASTAAQVRKILGVNQSLLDELIAHGFIGEEPYDNDDLTVIKAAAALNVLGLEIRHLRMYRQFKERELDVIQQLLAPALRHRQPERLRAATTMAEAILQHGDELHHALRARELREFFRQ